MDLKLPTVDDIRAAFREGEEAVVALFLQQQEIVLTLVARLEQQSELIDQQNRRIQELEARLNKNSRTSSKPPSSDGYAKPKRTKSQRQPGQKPTGGQPGHEGRTLKQVEQADEVIEHRPASCQHCGTDLQAVVGEVAEKRQVLDLPALRLWSVEHRRMDIVCPCCNQPNRGVLPDKVKGPIQYGDGVKALATLLTCGHHLPVARTGEILSDLFGQRVSDSLILEAATEAGEAVRPAVNAIREALIRSEILHVDESGLRVEGSLHWLHVASTDTLTWYQVHAKRGLEAMEAAGLLPHFKGVLVHDHWKSYFRYQVCLHALCNAHHLRELEWLQEAWDQPWAGAMRLLLLKIKAAVETARQDGQTELEPELLMDFKEQYEHLIGIGLTDNPSAPPNPFGKRKPKQTPPRNLLDRLVNYQQEVLRFMVDFRVPFDNNQGERDVRMAKLKQKIAGGFRTLAGAVVFAEVRSYLSTARKNGVSFYQALRDALAGQPFCPAASAGC